MSAGRHRDDARQHGTSLVEVMIATVLAVIGFVAIMSGALRLHALQRIDDELGHAYRSCRTNMERLHNAPLGTLLTFDGTGFDVTDTTGHTPLLRPLPGDPDGLPGRIEVSRLRVAGERELYRVVTTVQWAGAGGNQEVTFASMWGGVP